MSALCIALTTAGWLASAQAQAPTSQPTPAASSAAGEQAHGLIVKLKPEADATPQRSLERLNQVFQKQSMPMGVARRTGGPDTYLIRWERNLSSDEAAQLLKGLQAHPDVLWATPNEIEQAMQVATPNDPVYLSDQWWLSASSTTAGSRGVPNIAQAWNQATGSASVTVAVVDTGLLRSHPDLQGDRFQGGYDLVGNDDGLSGDGDGPDADFSDPGDGRNDQECSGRPASNSTWHGTGIASQIGASTQNGIGVAGIQWQARVVSVRVARKCGALTTTVVDGLRWAAGLSVADAPPNPHPARVINLSFGSANTDCRPFQDTIDELRSRGILLVAGAGDDDSAVNRPARCPGVMAVSALNRDGFKARYSSFGPEVTLSTVGGDPPDQSATLDPVGAQMADTGLVMASNSGLRGPLVDGYQSRSGSSFSAPVVAGVAALMLSVNPALSLDQLAYGLQVTARPHVSTSGFSSLGACTVNDSKGRCYCAQGTCGAGILDAARALAYASNPGAYGAAPAFGATTGSTSASPAAPATDSGGGALSAGWLLGLAGTVLTLWWVGRVRSSGRARKV